MTFNNWKSLNIGGNQLKKLVRASDGLVLFEKQEEYPNWICFDYLTPEITGTSIRISFAGSATGSFLYSYDRKSWTEINSNYNNNIIIDASHPHVWIKAGPGGNTTLSTSSTDYISITPVNYDVDINLIKIAVRGNIFSLLDAENFESITSAPNYCFTNIFTGIYNNRSVLTDASGLILTNGYLKCTSNTFYQMFCGQKHLEKGP